MTRIPLSALLFGLAGLVPFVWGAVTLFSPPLAIWSVGNLGVRFTGQFVLQDYALVILCFMSGVIWGFATRATGRLAMAGYALSVLPALWAFFVGRGDPGSSIMALLAGFVALLALDYMFWKAEVAPAWWLQFRLLLTSIVAACLAPGTFA